MISCFENIIGIRGTCGAIATPSSGLYIQDLPFIDLKVADAVLTDQDSATEYLTQKIRYASEIAKSEFNRRLSPFFKQTSLLEGALLGNYREDMTALPSAAKMRGVQIKIDQYPNLEFNLSGISLYSSNYTGDVTIKVHNLITGQEIDSFTIAVTQNEINFIEINKKYPTNGQRFNIFISYDATAISSFESSVSMGRLSNCSSCDRSMYSARYMSYNSGQFDTGSTMQQQNMEYTGNTAGLSLRYNIACSTEGFMCQNKNHLAFAILHKTGAEICKDVVNGTKRINSITTIDREKAAALIPDFEQVYIDSMAEVLNYMQLPNDLCIKCDQRIRTRTRLPA